MYLVAQSPFFEEGFRGIFNSLVQPTAKRLWNLIIRRLGCSNILKGTK